jgi:phospholipase C
MDTRREFLKKASLLAGGTGLLHVLPSSISRAFAINPTAGSTFMDAEHIVLLMQENRSFDHTYGTLQGVRGFNDPRVIMLPDKKPAWCQSNSNGETYAPFRLDIKNTNATWMESLPHGWTDQVDARNHGRYDKWLDNKRSGVEQYKEMPLTMGFYTREDIPFYYSLADAFTVCDHSFCSSLTGTTANRLYFWTGTIRDKPLQSSLAHVWNGDADHDSAVSWKTFPERLEENNISWKIYQNEIGSRSALKDEHETWLGNFGDNPIEYFTQFRVNAKDGELSGYRKNIHERAFTTNKKDPAYHELTSLKYKDGDIEREVLVPKGDIFFQFREDVKNGKLPAVSWLVAPQNFSDHPSSAWYGAWYISEAMDILTKNPEVWQKTIFILTYDENDGYFDHLPPFTAPHPHKRKTGTVSSGVSTETEFVSDESQQSSKNQSARISPIGLGYRVPLVIASPWSRGGWVNSQVFDHTSSLMFLEKFLSNKFNKKIHEPNISSWRRTVCGDLTSAFRPYNGEDLKKPDFLDRDEFVEAIHKAQFRNPPANFNRVTQDDPSSLKDILPEQEKGTREANSLPYELYADGKLSADKRSFEVRMQAANKIHGKQSAGSPFNVYAAGLKDVEAPNNRSYAVKAGDVLKDSWSLADFIDNYTLRVYGPNGFYREFIGNNNDPQLQVKTRYQSGLIQFTFMNNSKRPIELFVKDNSYGEESKAISVPVAKPATATISTTRSHGWYDISVTITGDNVFRQTFAGRIEDGNPGRTDPLMGREL